MQDLRAKLEELALEAEDCELIAKLATDIKNRSFFAKMAVEYRSLANVVEDVIKLRATTDDRACLERSM
jgi:hypothetical protein